MEINRTENILYIYLLKLGIYNINKYQKPIIIFLLIIVIINFNFTYEH